MANAFVITHGTAGDLLPLIGVGAALAAEGHRVTVLTHHPYRDLVDKHGMGFVPIDTDAEYAAELATTKRFNEDLFRRPMAVARFYAQINWFDQIRRELTTMVERHAPGDTVVVARHTSGVSALMAAEAMGVPVAWVSTWPSQIHALPLMEKMYDYTIGPRMNQVRAEFGLPGVDDWGAWLDRPDLQIGLWPEWFDSAGSASPPHVHRTGFVTHEPAESGPVPAEADRLLRSGRPAVLIAGGTSMVAHERFYSTAAEGCARAGRVGLLVCPHRELVPDRLPAGVHWFRRLPFRDVMPRVSAVIHHGGISTVARALASRTPQVILPFNLDRPDNAARLHKHRLARWAPVGQWSADRVAQLLATSADLRVDPPTPIDSAASARAAARLIGTLLR
ncbi:glycosyltransferase [Rhizomonospora bruguierae]|uniref:glycosyltransferase n=1 Tax=Rhizomonospora bruguierae TaxID=1581705 RepID=UPI001BD197E6|nr:glycosyltransferase [Micromonospora sp. NBRC 107566]